MRAVLFFTLLINFFIFSLNVKAQSDLLRGFQQSREDEYSGEGIKAIHINNRHGHISYTGWDKENIVINAVIWVNAPILPAASDIYNEISIIAQQSDGILKYNTHFPDNFFSIYDFGISYHISGPPSMALNFQQSFGNVILNNANGRLTLALEYGNLLTDKNTALSDGELVVSNGNIDLNRIDHAKITHQNGSLSVKKAGQLQLNSDFSRGTIGVVNELSFSSNTGNLEIDQVSSVRGEAVFTFIEINNLYENGFIEMEEGSLTISKTQQSMDELTISSINAPIEIAIPDDISYTIHGQAENGSFYHSRLEEVRIIRENNITTFNGHFIRDTKINPAAFIIFGKDCDIRIKTE